MPFDAERFLAVSDYLFERTDFDDRETLHRTAVGRLYYAMFLKIRRYLRMHGTRASTFGSVFAALTAMPGFSRVGSVLDQLHGLRNRCDYDDSNEFGLDDVERARRLAALIQELMAAHW